jgi:hypothetical protein
VLVVNLAAIAGMAIITLILARRLKPGKTGPGF